MKINNKQKKRRNQNRNNCTSKRKRRTKRKGYRKQILLPPLPFEIGKTSWSIRRFLRFIGEKFEDGTYNLLPEARWSTIINTPAPQLNVALDTALHSIATSSKQLMECFVEDTFTTRNLAPNDIKKIVDEVNKISYKAFGEGKDLIGRVYEYFLKEFAVNATKEEGSSTRLMMRCS